MDKEKVLDVHNENCNQDSLRKMNGFAKHYANKGDSEGHFMVSSQS